ncbi:hypothetical protein BAE44_0006160 [Dichanthelium oligosanthes]|uniref:Uncharacterized protein n=1 Tax=Dichanthelium oligosanthes TaxID=888268 RepID=A0A1E5W635_9POAL|nr:hypothetical protein BAE44_0006160 [Dichanthelium oligosanthes]
MDFLALPRRDLQALCKRNGIRANMTNAAMADALRALPAIDGIEEYVKQPVAVPEVAVAQEEEEPRLDKQGSPLPRGRRVTAKASEPVKPNDAKEGNATREPSKEDAPALGAGRRGASRRARPAPVVPKPTGKASTEEEKKRSPLASARRVEDGEAEEDLKREANKENAPAPVVGRAGASRRARLAPAAESAGAEAGEGQREKQGNQVPRGRRVAVKSSEPIRPDDCQEIEKEDLKREESTEDAPALGVGRGGASRRTRPAPALAAPAGKAVAEEEKTAPIPRGRHVKARSTEPIKPNNGEEDEKEGTKPEEEEADLPALGVCRRGASRHARRAPAVAAPAGKVAAEEEPRALIPSGDSVNVKSPEVIRLDDSEEEEKEDTKPEEKDEDAPAIGVVRRGASRHAPTPVEVPAMRSRIETGDVAVEAMPIRVTRQRKPTMKAAAAAEQKAPRKVTRRSAVRKTDLQQDGQDEPQGAVSDAEAVPAPVSAKGCDGSGNSEEASGPQSKEQNEVVAAPKQEEEDVVIIEDDILMLETPAEEPLVTDQECMDKSTLKEQKVNVEKCPVHLGSQEDSPILGVVSIASEQVAVEDDEGSSEEQLENGMCQGIHDAGEEMEMVPIIQWLQTPLPEEPTEEVVTSDANHESEMRNANEAPHGTKETSEVNAEDDLVSQEKENIHIDELQADLVDGSVLVGYSENISLVAKEEVNSEDDLSSQEKGDVAVDKMLPDMVAEAIPSDCSGDITSVEVDKAGDITSEMPESPVALDEDGEETNFYADICHSDEPNEVVIGDSVSQVTVTGGKVVQEEKVVVTTDEMPQGTSAMHEDVEEDQFQTVFVHADQVVTADCVPEVKMIDCEAEEEKMIISKKQQSTVSMDEDVVDDQFETDDVQANEQKEVVTINEVSELTGTNCAVVEEDKADVITEEMPHSTTTIDEDMAQTVFVHAGKVATADSVPEVKMADCEAEEKTELIIDEKKQSTVTMDEDVVDDHLEADVVHADEQKKVVTTDEVPELIGTMAEVVEEDKGVVITEEVPQSTGTMDECVQKNHFEIGFVQDDEQNNAVITDNMPEVTGTDGDAENTFTSDLPQELSVAEESNDHITSGLLDDVTESLSKSITTEERTLSVSEDLSVCKNSSEKNTTEPVAMQEEKGVKVAKKSVDLTKLSLGQLRTKLKEKLNAKKNKEAKRVALARVDENVCRSNTKGQLQNQNLQQH